MARRRPGWLAWPTLATTSTTWQGGAGPDPNRPADLGPGPSYRRADRYIGRGQPRQYPDPQKLRQGPVYAPALAEHRPLTQSSPAGGVTTTVVDHRGPEPIGTAQVLSIQAIYGAAQAGELGEIRWGMPGMPRDSVYDGDLGARQRWFGAQGVGQPARVGVRGGMLSGLPSTGAPGSMPLSDVQSALIQSAGFWG